MKITRKSVITGDTHVWDLPITLQQVADWQAGAHVQDAMPHLNADQREFLINGTTPEEWEKYMGTDDE